MKSHVRSDWNHAILICRKCQKRMKGGFGKKGRSTLSRELRKRLNPGKGRKAPVGIVETSCLDICPKKGVVLVDSRRPGIWRIVSADADLDELAAELLTPSAGQPSR